MRHRVFAEEKGWLLTPSRRRADLHSNGLGGRRELLARLAAGRDFSEAISVCIRFRGDGLADVFRLFP
jgi:hypothetical protein